MKKTDAIIFDLDGTLLNTIEDLADAINHALGLLGLDLRHTPEACKQFVGHGVRVMVERALPPDRRDAATLNTCVNAVREEYARNWNRKTRLYHGIPELLDALTQTGMPMCILTNKPEANARQIADHYFARWPFAIVRGAREDTPLKPDPAASLDIADALGVTPAACLHVGDSAVDMRTARAAGMFAVGVTWGFRGREEIAAAGADAIIDDPADVLQWITPDPVFD
ncbi:MAG: HAD family hydrolase [Spartobacteria bacterium]|nr:HAD family hydrolase [Spartobacteria bacterium]